MASDRIDFSKEGTVHDFIEDCYQNIRKYCRARETSFYKTHWEDKAQDMVYQLLKYYGDKGVKPYSVWFGYSKGLYANTFYVTAGSRAHAQIKEFSEEIEFEEIFAMNGYFTKPHEIEIRNGLHELKAANPTLYELAERILIDKLGIKESVFDYYEGEFTPNTCRLKWHRTLLPEIKKYVGAP